MEVKKVISSTFKPDVMIFEGAVKLITFLTSISVLLLTLK